ncbi:hypothetical protein C8J57DRAFT_1512152 [Mycena rebaudengoi]|nr:hypothetical protein C8J57DRAFT_1512152 [Mycena rebaudengoi]
MRYPLFKFASLARRHQRLLIFCFAIICMFVGTLVAIVAGHTLAENRVPAVDATQADATNPPVVTPFPTSEYPVESQDNVDPSSNLEGAITRYSLKTGRPPPRGFDKSFEFPRDRACLTNEHDQIH